MKHTLKIISSHWLILSFVVVSSRQASTDIKFKAKDIPQNPVYRPGNRFEHAERNTSVEYGWWQNMTVVWIEWPGNITRLEPEYPLLQWSKRKERGKLIQNPCNNLLGMDFKAYAYKFVHLTWGPFRMTASYCPPMKVPRDKLRGLAKDPKSPYLSVSDFEFIEDALLVIIEDRFILRIGELEASYLEQGTHPIPSLRTLSYDVSYGITHPVTKLVTQSCCKQKSPTCIHGETVLAYNEGSSDFNVFISTDSASNFRQVSMKKPNQFSTILHSALLYPSFETVLLIHGNETHAQLRAYNSETGKSVQNKNAKNVTRLEIKGNLQAQQLGEESSLVIWDECRVWYSHNAGASVTEALFYINHSIHKDFMKTNIRNKKHKKDEKKHHIRSKHCYLGKSATLAYDSTGKIGLIDSNNIFFYGIDTKSKKFPLVGTAMDMSLLMKGKERSIVPFFDFNNRPKLMYPPRYLVIDDPIVHTDHYPKRLGMRLFPRSVFPSDFIPPYFDENIPRRYIQYGFSKCQTSSISIDSSISQKSKIFTTKPGEPYTFILEFKSFLNTYQLNVEPKHNLQFLKITIARLASKKLGEREYYYFKYKITVTPKSEAVKGNLYRLNFFTKKSIRCVHQPQVTVWIKIGDGVTGMSDYDDNRIKYPPGVTVDTPEMAFRHIQACEENPKGRKRKTPLENQACSYTPFEHSNKV